MDDDDKIGTREWEGTCKDRKSGLRMDDDACDESKIGTREQMRRETMPEFGLENVRCG